MKVYPRRLFHKIPSWMPERSVFHIRINALTDSPLLTSSEIADSLLRSVEEYVNKGLWSCYLMVLMPDHIHALLSFGVNKGMSETIRNWKRGQSRMLGVRCQDNYFDHRIRDHAEFTKTFVYLERNPVEAGLCETPEDWPYRVTCFSAETIVIN